MWNEAVRRFLNEARQEEGTNLVRCGRVASGGSRCFPRAACASWGIVIRILILLILIFILLVLAVKVAFGLVSECLAGEEVDGARDDALLEVLADLVIELEPVRELTAMTTKSRGELAHCSARSSASSSSSSSVGGFGGVNCARRLTVGDIARKDGDAQTRRTSRWRPPSR